MILINENNGVRTSVFLSTSVPAVLSKLGPGRVRAHHHWLSCVFKWSLLHPNIFRSFPVPIELKSNSLVWHWRSSVIRPPGHCGVHTHSFYQSIAPTKMEPLDTPNTSSVFISLFLCLYRFWGFCFVLFLMDHLPSLKLIYPQMFFILQGPISLIWQLNLKAMCPFFELLQDQLKTVSFTWWSPK